MTENEVRLQKQMVRGAHAEGLLNNELLQGVFKTIEAEYLKAR